MKTPTRLPSASRIAPFLLIACGLLARSLPASAFQERNGGVRDGGGMPLPPGFRLLPEADFEYACTLTLRDFQSGRSSVTAFQLNRASTGFISDQAVWSHFTQHLVTGRLIPTAEAPAYPLVQQGTHLEFQPVYDSAAAIAGWNVDLHVHLNVDEPRRLRSVEGFTRQAFSGAETLFTAVTDVAHTPRGDERLTAEARCTRTK